jgi:D-alanine-D-alanine ligase
LPVFVKPAEGGSSIGMSKVTEPSQLEAAIQKAFQEDQQVLIESFIKGREVTCGQYVKDGVWEALPLTEIRTSKEFFDFEAKYTPGLTQELTPAPVTDEIAERIQQAAKTIYFALNCRGVVRTDFIVGDDGNLYFLEINTMPGQSENSIVPQQVRAAGKTLKEFYGTLIENCLRAAAQS